MYIVSKWRDYYDTASQYGIDKTCIYLRTELSIKANPGYNWNSDPFFILPDGKRLHIKKIPDIDEIKGDKAKYTFYKWIIGFCGNFYPVVKVKKDRDGKVTEDFFYDYEEVRKYLSENNIKDTKSFRYWFYGDDFDVRHEKSLSNFFDLSRWSKLDDIFHAFKVPVFAIGEAVPGCNGKDKMVLNPNLRKMGFMEVKDSYSAFQDIYSYIGGVLGTPPKPTKPIDDKTMAAARGHDSKYSFKRPPGQKKWR